MPREAYDAQDRVLNWKFQMDHFPHSTVLRNWAQLARPHRPTWMQVDAILKAARIQSSIAESRLRNLLKLSDALFDPLCDPLHADLGLHRWLRKDREEAYSDWLAWIIEQIGDPQDLLKLLRINTPPILERHRGLAIKVSRELVIENGRLDLVIRVEQQMVLLIEVKLTSAEGADTGKNKGYTEWLAKQPEPFKRALLLIVEAEDDNYHDFVPIRWADLCIGLRGMISGSELRKRLSVVKRAMFVAFVGAVETNLLHLSTPRGDGYVTGLFYTRTAMHIEEALGKRHD